MDNLQSKNIKINDMITDSLTNDNFRHIYDVYLEKNKYYYITLSSLDNTEFNLRIYDSEKNIIKLKYDDKDENIFLADLNNNLNQDEEDDDDDGDYDDEYEDEEDEDDEGEEYEEDEDNNENNGIINVHNNDMLNNLIMDILGSSKNPFGKIDDNKDDNQDDSNKIEIIIEVKDNISNEDSLPNEDDLEALLKNNDCKTTLRVEMKNVILDASDRECKPFAQVCGSIT